MSNRLQVIGKVSLVALVGALVAAPALTQQSGSPIARYTVDAGTTSGMGAMGGGGAAAAMSILRGGGSNQVSHELMLRLGSTRTATAPAADHFMPQGAGLGASVPLVTPERVSAPPGEPGQMPQGQMPQGRLLLFWGCGEHAPPNQPVIIDFSKLARGQIPPGLYAQALNLPDDWRILQGNATTYGEWPNSRDGKSVPANASLLGAHRIAGNYSPEINFTLDDDFMGVVLGTSHHEPLTRAHVEWERALEAKTASGEWNYAINGETLRRFWRAGMERANAVPGLEYVATVGMRGDGDEAMSEQTAIPLLEQIVADQRKIIADVTGRPAAATPQVWALYKEVQDYYDQGMRVPDDVTLLFSDDNWGQIRRLPVASALGGHEKRKGFLCECR